MDFENYDPMMDAYDSQYEIEETHFDDYFDQFDDDPSPFLGTYSEE